MPRDFKEPKKGKTLKISKKFKRKGARVTSVDIDKEPVKKESETVGEPVDVPEAHGEVEVSLGMTIGLPRKYEFARIDVSSRMPHEPNEKAREKAFQDAMKFCGEKMNAEIVRIRDMEKKKQDVDL